MGGHDVRLRLGLPHLPAIELSITQKAATVKPGEVRMFKEKVDGIEYLVIIANGPVSRTVTLISKHGTLQV